MIDATTFSDATKEIAKNELREEPAVVQAAIEELRALLKADTTINFRDDDDFLLIFLRPCKFYAKSAHELMQRVAKFKNDYKDLLDGLLPEQEKNCFINHNVVNVLKERDHLGRRVLLVNIGKSWDTSAVTSDQLFRIFYLIHEAAMLEPETQVRGVVVIMDFNGLSMSQVKALTPAFSYKLLTFIQEAMPLRLKEVHMVKEPFIFNIVWALFKPLIKQKLKKRIFFHGSKMASLQKHIPKSHLPADYDGDLPAIDYTGADWYPAIDKHIEHIKQWNTYGLVKK